MNRNTEWTIDRDINIADTTLHVGAKLSSYFNTQLLSFSYKYNIFARETWNAGISFGIRFLRIKTAFELTSNNVNKSIDEKK